MMVLCYDDYVISISATPNFSIVGIQDVFKLKRDKAEVPNIYLGAGMENVMTASVNECWMLSQENYTRTAVANLKYDLACKNHQFTTKCHTPFVSGYHPKNETSKDLDSKGTRCYQELIGVLRW